MPFDEFGAPRQEREPSGPADEPWLDLLAEEDRDFIAAVFSDDVVDPGRRTRDQLDALNDDEREDYDQDRLEYLRMTPLLDTKVVEAVLAALETSAKAAPSVLRHRDRIKKRLHSQDIMILDGAPGVGKTMICNLHLASEMVSIARRRWRALQRGDVDSLDEFRPVVSLTLRGPVTGNQLLAMICRSLRRPVDKDPERSFLNALTRCGLQLLFIDEIHAVNFDGKTGDHVHHMIRWIANNGVRVVLASNDTDWVLQNHQNPNRKAGARISRGRWVRLDVPKLEIDTAEGLEDWQALLLNFEDRFRLVDQPLEEGWLADGFGMYLWASTQGYMNALVRILNDGAARAMETGVERIDRALFDEIELQAEVQAQRARQLSLIDPLRDAS